MYSSEDNLLFPQTRKGGCLKITLVGLFVFLVFSIATNIAMLWLSRNTLAELNPHNCVIITPWLPDPNKPSLKPCVLGALTHQGSIRWECREGVYCPVNYTCSKTFVTQYNNSYGGLVDICVSTDFKCGDVSTCASFMFGTDSTVSEGIMAIVFHYEENTLFWVSFCIQLFSLLFLAVFSVAFLAKTNPESSRSFSCSIYQQASCVTIFCIVEIILLIIPQVIQFIKVDPSYYTMTSVLSAQCFSPSPTWFVQLVNIGIIQITLLSLSILGTIFFSMALLSYTIPYVRQVFWNCGNLALMFMLFLVSTGIMSLIELALK